MDAHQDRPLTQQPIIGIKGGTRRFGAVVAVDDVTMDIGRGEFFCLLGGSGSGKSTLLRAAAGLVPHFHGGTFAGRLRCDGLDTREHGPADLVRNAGSGEVFRIV